MNGYSYLEDTQELKLERWFHMFEQLKAYL